MPKAGVLIWLVIALALGVGAMWLVRSRPSGPAARSAVLGISPARISALAITPRGGVARHLVRDPATGDWMLDGSGGQWPVQLSNVQGAIRLLAGLQGREAERSAEAPGPGHAEVRISLDNREDWTLWLADRSLGGERLARVQPPGNTPSRTVLVDGSLFDALIASGPDSWRVPLVFTEPTADASRLTLIAPQGRIVLGRVGARWAMQEPVATPADQKAVQALVRSLASIRIARFLDSPPDSAAGLDSPIATASIEFERRIPRGQEFDTATLIRTLIVGGPASIDGGELFASVDRSIAAPGTPAIATSTAITIDRAAVDAISMDPTAYIAPTPFAAPASEIGAIEVARGSAPGPVRRFERTLDGWRAQVPDAANSVLPVGPDAEQIGALLRLLCEQAPGRITLEQSAGNDAITVRLFSLGGSPLGEVRIVRERATGEPMDRPDATGLLLISGPVTRMYDHAPWRGLLEWLGPAFAPTVALPDDGNPP